MNNEALLNMILRHGARLEKIENDLRYIEREVIKLNLSTHHIQKAVVDENKKPVITDGALACFSLI